MQKMLQESQLDVWLKGLLPTIHSNNLFGRPARSNPLLSSNYKCKGLELAKCHSNCDWNWVLWSDDIGLA